MFRGVNGQSRLQKKKRLKIKRGGKPIKNPIQKKCAQSGVSKEPGSGPETVKRGWQRPGFNVKRKKNAVPGAANTKDGR